MNIRELCDQAMFATTAIFSAPMADPDAPAGYLTTGYVEAERRRRYASASKIIDDLLATIERDFGPVPGAVAREHFAPVLAMFGGTQLH